MISRLFKMFYLDFKELDQELEKLRQLKDSFALLNRPSSDSLPLGRSK